MSDIIEKSSEGAEGDKSQESSQHQVLNNSGNMVGKRLYV